MGTLYGATEAVKDYSAVINGVKFVLVDTVRYHSDFET